MYSDDMLHKCTVTIVLFFLGRCLLRHELCVFGTAGHGLERAGIL